MSSGTTAIAYETVQSRTESLPLLAPMSEVAGRLSIVVGAAALMSATGGSGTLLGDIPGTPKAKVIVIGGGVAGEHAANALGLGADVTVIDISYRGCANLKSASQGAVQETRASTRYEIADQFVDAILVIGSILLIPGAAAPKLVTDDMVATMKTGSVLVDIAIDQGGSLRRLPTHNARFAHLRRAQFALLLRRQHARRHAQHIDARPQQRNTALHRGNRTRWLGRCRGR